MEKQYYVYILTNKPRGVFYVGFTSDLLARDWQHKNKVVNSFTKKYNLCRLVYYEVFTDPENAILREKKLKRWHRQWKIEIIEKQNAEWKNLWPSL